MRRRDFLVKTSRSAIGVAFFRALPTAQTRGAAAAVPRIILSLEREIPDLMEETRVPGASLAVIRDGKLHWRRGFGVRRAGSQERVDHETVFEAGSVSKTVFAYAVMKLVERGVIDLDTPLTRYSPLRILEDPRLDLITARHVLSHTSGLQNWRSERDPLSIHFRPGERYLYSGEGYSYLQSVITRLTGHVDSTRCGKYEGGVAVCATDFDSYMHANVFVPFGMDSSGYVWTKRFDRHAAEPHDEQGRLIDRKRRPSDIDAARYGAAGGLLTTPTDYGRFLIEIVNPKSSDSFRLQTSTISEMVRPLIKGGDSPASSRGLGWEVVHTDDDDIIVHGGDNSGFHAFAAASRKRKTGYMVMTNGDGGTNLIRKLIIGDTALNQLLGS